MSTSAAQLVQAARTRIREIAAPELQSWRGQGAVLVDVREPAEYATGHIEGPVNIVRGVLAFELQARALLENVTDPALADSPADSLDVDQPGYNQEITVDGLGVFHTRWRVQTVAAVSPNLKFIAVQTEIRGPLSRRTRAEFTTLRARR